MKKMLYVLMVGYSCISSAIEIRPGVFIPPSIYRHQEEPLDNAHRYPSFPYMSGDTFRGVATIFVDELRMPLNPDDVKDGDIIFLKPILKEYFFTEVHPRIRAKYILISHNCDFSSPGKFRHILDDENLIAWFTVNPDVQDHPKLIGIPIGLANKYWPYGNADLFHQLRPALLSIEKDKLLYLNVTFKNNQDARMEMGQLFYNKPYCYFVPQHERKPWHEYLKDIARSKFVLSPHGAGLDCYRTWEAMWLGSIPVVKKSTLDPMYEDLPVIIVNDWKEVTEEFLLKKWHEMKSKTYNLEKLYAAWWINRIKTVQSEFLKNRKK